MGWRVDPEISAVGHFVDLGSHILDLLDRLLGPVTQATGVATNRGGRYLAEDLVTGVFSFRSGVEGVGVWNYDSFQYQDQVEIIGTAGALSFSCFADWPLRLLTASGLEQIEAPYPETVQLPLIQLECLHEVVAALQPRLLVHGRITRTASPCRIACWARPRSSTSSATVCSCCKSLADTGCFVIPSRVARCTSSAANADISSLDNCGALTARPRCHLVGLWKVAHWSYAVSKLFDEHLAFAYQESFGFPVTVLRFFGSYGPRHHLSWWGGPQSVFIDAVLNDREIPIHGDGLQTRSFTYVSDTIEGIYAAIVNPQANGEIFNIGSTHEITILELARTIKRLSNTPGELKLKFITYESFTGRKYEDVRHRVPDLSRCERVLGVKAKVSLEAGLLRTIDWQRSVIHSQYQVISSAAISAP